jgi:hypothetical protein
MHADLQYPPLKPKSDGVGVERIAWNLLERLVRARHSDSFLYGKIRLWLHEKVVAGLGSSQSKSSPKKRGRSTPTAKRTPNIRRLALGCIALVDHVTAKAKPGPINARNTTRSSVATSARSISTSGKAPFLLLFRLTSLRMRAGAALLLFVLG